MKKFLAVALCAFFAAISAPATLNPAERAIVVHIKEVVRQQARDLQDVRARVVWLDKELKDIQPKIDQIGLERDQWKSKYDIDHEKLMKDEAALLRRDIAIGVLGFLFLGMVVWKFKLYRLIPGLSLAP